MIKLAFPLFALWLVAAFPASAQNPGCDGIRYKDNIFAAVKKTTVQYATAPGYFGTETLYMDVYEPQGDNLSRRPVVVLAHGGSFMFGDKGDMKRWCELLAKKGYIAASVQYRLYPFFLLGIPDSTKIFDTAVKAVGDMKAAVRYFREDDATANKFRADAANIFIGGYSAGAVAALHAGFLDAHDSIPAFVQTIIGNNGGFNGNSGSAANQTYSSTIKAVLNMSGGLYRSNWVDSLDVPLVSIHGTNDETVPFYYGLAADIAYLEGSGLIHPKAAAAGLLNSLHPVPGGGHTNIYEPSQTMFVPHIDTFWVNATTIMEFLTCGLVDAGESAPEPENWSVFPNPTTGNALFVQLPASIRQAALTLLDVSGKIVFQTQYIQNEGFIQTNNLPPGVYTVQISDLESPMRRFPAKRLVVVRRE